MCFSHLIVILFRVGHLPSPPPPPPPPPLPPLPPLLNSFLLSLYSSFFFLFWFYFLLSFLLSFFFFFFFFIIWFFLLVHLCATFCRNSGPKWLIWMANENLKTTLSAFTSRVVWLKVTPKRSAEFLQQSSFFRMWKSGQDLRWGRRIQSKFRLVVIRRDPLLKTLEKKGRSKQKSNKPKE